MLLLFTLCGSNLFYMNFECFGGLGMRGGGFIQPVYSLQPVEMYQFTAPQQLLFT